MRSIRIEKMQIKFVKIEKKIKKFLFPISKPFSSIKTLTFIAIIFALYIFLVLCTIHSVLNFSISWIPIMVLGWYLGPIYSCFLTIIFDNIRFFLLSQVGGLWFWLYAIQAPLVALISSLFGGLFHYRINAIKSSCSKSIIFDVMLANLIVVSFFVFTIFMLLSFVNNSTKFSGSEKIEVFFLNVYKWIAISLLTFSLIGFETIIINCKRNRQNRKNFILRILILCYCSSLVLVVMFIFPFILQPIATIEYCKYCGFPNRSFLFYLIPQTFRQSIIVPIEIFVLKAIILLAQKQFNEINDQINNQWKK